MTYRPTDLQTGFTLIEVIVVIAIMAMAMGLTVGIVGDSFERQAAKQTSKLAATIRFAYHASISGRTPHRLVFDLTEGKYWVEISAGEPAPVEEEATEEGIQADEPPPGEDAEPQKEKETFVISEEEIIRRVSLPDSLKFRDVQTARDDAPVTEGLAYLYFFPSGFTEEAAIHFTNEEGNADYSVIVSPLTGTSRIEKGYVDLEKTAEE